MYGRLLGSHPVITKCVTSGVIMSFGDILTQKIVEKKEEINWKRNINLSILGTIYLGPCLHVWYTKMLPQVVNRMIGSNQSKFKFAFTGMLFDQILFAPVLLSAFFTIQGVIDEKRLDGIEKGMKMCKDKIWETLLANWKIWPFATMINLSFVPIAYRVLFANLIGLFWNMYLSYVSYS